LQSTALRHRARLPHLPERLFSAFADAPKNAVGSPKREMQAVQDFTSDFRVGGVESLAKASRMGTPSQASSKTREPSRRSFPTPHSSPPLPGLRRQTFFSIDRHHRARPQTKGEPTSSAHIKGRFRCGADGPRRSEKDGWRKLIRQSGRRRCRNSRTDSERVSEHVHTKSVDKIRSRSPQRSALRSNKRPAEEIKPATQP